VIGVLVRLRSLTEYLAAWLIAAGALLLLVGWHQSLRMATWVGATLLVLGAVLWLRQRNRQRPSRWVKQNDDV